MRVLDRAFFHREYPISAAKIFDLKSISRVQKEFSKSNDILNIRATYPVQPVPDNIDTKAQKCILLRPEVQHNGTQEAVTF